VVRAFAEEADRRVIDALERTTLDRPGDPLLDRAEAVFSILEREAMHQETLLYMWYRLPFSQKRRPATVMAIPGGGGPKTGNGCSPNVWRTRCSGSARAPVGIGATCSRDFDGEHFVMKGASPATSRDLLRPTFRNWFRPRYPLDRPHRWICVDDGRSRIGRY